MAELSMDELYEKHTEEGVADEASRFDTAPAGKYTYAVDGVEPRVGDKPEIERLFERQYAHLAGTITDKEGNNRGKQWVDVSWETRRDTEGKLDRPSKLWGQLVTALNMVEASVGEVLDAIKQFPVYLYITESFETDEINPTTGRGQWRSVKDPAKKAEYIKAGFRAANFPQAIAPIKS